MAGGRGHPLYGLPVVFRRGPASPAGPRATGPGAAATGVRVGRCWVDARRVRGRTVRGVARPGWRWAAPRCWRFAA
jgi:hypothetical protein